jgi:hypothetical protein
MKQLLVIPAVFLLSFLVVSCESPQNDGRESRYYSECDIINVRDHVSPDGQRVATVYGNICYNTTGYDKYVDLHRAGRKMRHPGNVTAVGPGDVVSVAWTSPTELIVSYCYESLRPGPATTNIDGVTIRFKERPELRGAQQ